MHSGAVRKSPRKREKRELVEPVLLEPEWAMRDGDSVKNILSTTARIALARDQHRHHGA